MFKRKLFFSAAALALVGLLSGCGQKQAGGGQHVSLMTTAEVATMDLSKGQDATTYEQLNNTMEGLYYLGPHAVPKKALATSAKASNNQKTWTFTLRKAKWSNGQPVTAQDFVYSWERTLNPRTGSQYAYLFSGIKNANAINAKKKSPRTLGIKAVGKHKLVVQLDQQIPYFKVLLAFPLFFPQNKQAVQKYGSKYGTNSKDMVYNGPFKMTGWTGSNLSWKLVKNPDYWDKKAVKLDCINYSTQKSNSTAYNLYQTKKLDEAKLDPQAARQQAGKAGYTLRAPAQTDFLDLNTKKKAFQNRDLRLAFSQAINRQQLAKSIGPSVLPLHTFTARKMTEVKGEDFTKYASTKASIALTSYNKASARKYYQQALRQLGKKSLSFTLLSTDDDASKRETEFVQSQLETNLPHLSIKVQSLPSKSLLNRLQTGHFDATVFGWVADFADPISFLDCATTGNSYNYGNWSNKQYDQLIAASRRETSASARMKDLARAENLLMTQQGITPLVQPGEAWLVNPKLKGIIYNGAGIDYNFKFAYLSK